MDEAAQASLDQLSEQQRQQVKAISGMGYGRIMQLCELL